MYDSAFQLAAQERPVVASYADTYRKIDKRITPLLCGVYFLQFLDKSLLNYAAVMGIKKNLSGNQFSNLGTILYVAFIVGEPLNKYLFQRLPPAKLMAANVLLWGAVIIGHAFCKTYASLMVVRALLGLFEACVAPGCTLITGMWYNPLQQLRRTCWWTCQAGTSTIIGGLLSFAFQHIHTRFQSWQIFYLVMGGVTVLFGLAVLFWLPDSPMDCSFLTHDEKVLVIENIRENMTGTTSGFEWSQIKELFLEDPHTYPMLALTLLLMIPTGAVLTFSVTIIADIGFSNENAALVQMPLGVSTILAIVLGTHICAYFRGTHRNYVFVSMLVPAIIGYIVLLSSKDKIGQLLAVYLINVGTCVITMLYLWNSANTAGYTKRVARSCATMVFYAVGCLIGPQLFRALDAPYYTRAKIALLVFECVSIPLVLLVSAISRRLNKSKSGKMEEHHEFMDLTDMQNECFIYSY